MEDRHVRNEILRKLRETHPHRVRVYVSQAEDSEYRDLAVPGGRKRWAPVVEMIEGRPWGRIELQDKAGLILGEVRNESGSLALTGGEDELPAALPQGMAAVPALVRWIVSEIIRAQQMALTYRDKEHGHLMQSVVDMLRVNTEAVRSLSQIHQAQLSAAVDAAQARAEAESTGDLDKVVKILEASPELIGKILPFLGSLMRRPPGPSPAAAAAKPAAQPPASAPGAPQKGGAK